MKKADLERNRPCIIIFAVMLYMIIMFPPVDYKGIGRVYAIFNWKGQLAWTEIIIEITAAVIITGIVYVVTHYIKK